MLEENHFCELKESLVEMLKGFDGASAALYKIHWND